MKRFLFITSLVLSLFQAINAQENEKRSAFIVIDNVYLPITLENNAFADSIYSRMPFTLGINNFNSEIFSMDTDLRSEESSTQSIEKGLLFYHNGTKCIMLAHKEFSVNMDMVKIGKVTESGLKKLERISPNATEATYEQ